MPKVNLMPDEGSYVAFLNELKTRIRAAQVKAALAVNQELLQLYWQVGTEILARQQAEGWGTKVITRLSKDLKQEFPDIKGFSARNLGYMKSFAEAWPDAAILQEALAKIPWYHNITLLEKLKDPEQRLWYAQQAFENGWSRNVLVSQIETNLYRREVGVVTNFDNTLPPPQSDLAYQVLKDPYNLDFLTIAKDAQEQDLKRALVKHMRDFLLELGVGFSFVGHNYRLEVDDKDFYLDMLFYHFRLRCFVAIQLEMGEFIPEHSGKMNFYLMAVDAQERGEMDQPTIGIILCKTKSRTVAKYALGNLRNPIAVATHKLPDTEQLQSELDNAVRLLKGDNKEVNTESNESE